MGDDKYSDIIHLPHYTSKTRQRMPISERAAQFSPFAALKGYEDGIEEAARYEELFQQSEYRTEMLEEKLEELERRAQERPTVKVVYFNGEEGQSGTFRSYQGRLIGLDLKDKKIVLEGMEILFSQIKELEL